MAITPRFEPLAINTLHHNSSLKQCKPINASSLFKQRHQ